MLEWFENKIMKHEGNIKYVEKLDPWSTHTKISTYLRKMPSSMRVLDAGCATGILGKLCSGHNLIINGIEENSDWARFAQPYYNEVFIGKLEDTPAGFLENYDIIVLADVLEHLPQSEKVLARICSLQKVGCIFIISVPNIANIWIRINLLLGKFEYQERGILDKTHMRFFTYRSLKQLLSEVQLNLISSDVTPVPLGLISNFFIINKFGIFMYKFLNRITRIFRKLFGYQFIAISKKC
jgi:2-polyprenyl-3-methyl-5-hydroxy-6-metoxy-1,4-benzoquinol methylase